VIGSGGDDSSRLNASFSFDRIEPNQVEGDVLEHGKVVRGGFGTGAHLVVVEGHIHDPVQSVLDRPVRADRLTDAFGIGGQAADIQAQLMGCFVAHRALRFEHREAVYAPEQK